MHLRRYTGPELEAAFTDAGLALEKRTYFNSWLFPIAFARRVGRRLTGTDDGVEFDVPAKPLNAFLRKVFRAETGAILRAGKRSAFPVGLSLLAVTAPVPGPAQPPA
jgi:hypothetical protein